MKARILSSIVAALTIGISSAVAVTINFTSPLFEIAKTSGGVELTGSFNFYLGSFNSFTPTAGNTSQWNANFVSLSSTAWSVDDQAFSGAAVLSSNAVFAQGSQAYIWGQGVVSGITEWILITNNSWLFPASGNLLPTSWDLTDAGTGTVIGTLGTAQIGADPYMRTSAVPEPSTYAAVFGVLAIGIVTYRRRRQTL